MAAAWLLLALLVARPAAAQEMSMVPVTVDGERVRLEMRTYRPATPGRAPTLVFNHGSTGRGTNPDIFTRKIDFRQLAELFVRGGWAVVMPARRGRGGSEGLYDEGFQTNRAAGYACDASLSITGADRALRDIEAAMEAIFAMEFVDRERVVIGGQSRGGILSVAYAGRHPEQVRGVINFVGGWLGQGCPTSRAVNQALFVRGARYPGETIWLYGDGDPFYALDHSLESFGAFQGAGGKGAFHAFAPWPGLSGHRIIGRPERWQSVLSEYLDRHGLPVTRSAR